MLPGPVRIAFVTTGLESGGAETMLLRLIAALDRERFEPSVISLASGGPAVESLAGLGVPTFVLGLRPWSFLLLGLPRLIRLLRSIRPSVIQGWMYHGNIAATLARPYVPGASALLWNVRMAGEDFRTEKRLTRLVVLIGARLASRADCLVTNSRKGALTHAVRLGYRGPWRVIPNGFDASQFVPIANPASRAELRIGMVARYHGIKDHGTFLAAAARLATERSNVRFVLIGEGMTWTNAALAESISAKGLRERVELLGPRSDIATLTATLDIASLSSISEGFPNAVGEAMSCGVPCVATDVGDAALLVGDTGILVPPRDPDALCAAWRALVDLGAGRRRALGQRARQRIMDHFSIASVALRYQDLFEQFAPRDRAEPCVA